MQAVIPQYLHNSHTLNVSSCPAELFFCEHQKINLEQNMSLLTILEASKQFNIGRTAIYKAIKKGEITPRLSDTGVQLIDPQDMVRIFGKAKQKSVSNHSTQHVSINNDELVRELREHIQELKQDKIFLKQEIESVRKDFDDFKLLIEHKQNTDIDKTGETVLKQQESSFREQKKQEEKHQETAVIPPVEAPKKPTGFLSRLFKLK